MSVGEFWLPEGEEWPANKTPYYQCKRCDVLGVGPRCWCCGKTDLIRDAERRWPRPMDPGGQETREFNDSDDDQNIDGHLFLAH